MSDSCEVLRIEDGWLKFAPPNKTRCGHFMCPVDQIVAISNGFDSNAHYYSSIGLANGFSFRIPAEYIEYADIVVMLENYRANRALESTVLLQSES